MAGVAWLSALATSKPTWLPDPMLHPPTWALPVIKMTLRLKFSFISQLTENLDKEEVCYLLGDLNSFGGKSIGFEARSPISESWLNLLVGT